MLGVSIQRHRAADTPQPRTPLDQRPASHRKNGQLAVLAAKCLPLPVVPVDRRAVPGHHRPLFLGQHLAVQLVLTLVAVPRVATASLPAATGESVVEPLVVRVQATGSLGQQPVAVRVEHVMKRLVVEVSLGRVVLVRLVHVPHDRPIASQDVGMATRRVFPRQIRDLVTALSPVTNRGDEMSRLARLQLGQHPVQFGVEVLAVEQSGRSQLSGDNLPRSIGQDDFRSHNPAGGQRNPTDQRRLPPIHLTGLDLQPDLRRGFEKIS